MCMWAAPTCSRAARLDKAKGTLGSWVMRLKTRASKRRSDSPIKRPRWLRRQSVEVRESMLCIPVRHSSWLVC